MATPSFVTALLGRRGGLRGNPNTSDADNAPSVGVGNEILNVLGVTRVVPAGENTGRLFEMYLRDWLRSLLPSTWTVERRELVQDFAQYAHLATVEEMLANPAMETIRTEIGGDYHIRPDVTVGRPNPSGGLPLLHASVSCKWTLRSDRAQNVRHEAHTLVRHRRGRLPHVVAVTLEPLPSRIVSLARGTGEVDAVYHGCLDELDAAIRTVGSQGQVAILDEMLGQGRLFDLDALAATLSV